MLKVAETLEQCLLWAVNVSIDYGVKDAPHLRRKHGDVQLFEAGYGQGPLNREHLWLHVLQFSKSGICSDQT